jgi:hypothetical protein
MTKRKTVKQPEKKQYQIEVIVESSCVTTRYAEQDQWDRDDTDTSHYVNGIRVVKEGSYSGYSVPVGFTPEYEAEYHVVCAQYSTADSFGRDDGSGFEVIGVYRNKDVADINVARIQEHADTYKRMHGYYNRLEKAPKGFQSYTVKLLTDDRKKHEMHVPWNGYFESLDWVRVDTFTLR